MILCIPVSFPTAGIDSFRDTGTGPVCPRIHVAKGWYALVWGKDSAAARRLSSLHGPVDRIRVGCWSCWLPLNVVANQQARQVGECLRTHSDTLGFHYMSVFLPCLCHLLLEAGENILRLYSISKRGVRFFPGLSESYWVFPVHFNHGSGLVVFVEDPSHPFDCELKNKQLYTRLLSAVFAMLFLF